MPKAKVEKKPKVVKVEESTTGLGDASTADSIAEWSGAQDGDTSDSIAE